VQTPAALLPFRSAFGKSYGGRIAILNGQSKAEQFSTLVHETAHELLHKAERRTVTTKTVRELEAEAVASLTDETGINTQVGFTSAF
jgi:hypothetical protein